MASWTSAPTVAAERGVVQRARTVDVFDLVRDDVGPGLAPFADGLWQVSWDRGDASPVPGRSLPFPSVNLTIEVGNPDERRHGHRLPAVLVHGVSTRTLSVPLTGYGWALGVRFHPAGWWAWTGRDASVLTDRAVPAEPLLTPLGLAGVGAAVLAEPDPVDRRAVLRAYLERHIPDPDPDYAALRGLVEQMRTDPGLTRVEQLPERIGWSLRTLQRHFRRRVGAPAKWVLARFRMQEAALALEQDPTVDLAALAVTLGWHDQAHFTTDFRRLLGTTPARYAAAARG